MAREDDTVKMKKRAAEQIKELQQKKAKLQKVAHEETCELEMAISHLKSTNNLQNSEEMMKQFDLITVTLQTEGQLFEFRLVLFFFCCMFYSH